MSTKKFIVKSAIFLGILTLISRILGLIKMQVISYYLGAGTDSDIFWAAFRIPNSLRKLLAEGALSIALIPVYTGFISVKRTRKEISEFISNFFNIIIIIFAFIVFLGIILASIYVPFLVKGFSLIPGKLEYTIKLTRVMFPYIAFIGLTAMVMGILNSYKNYTVPGLAPIIFNIIFIIGVIFSKGNLIFIAYTVVFAGFAGFVVQLPFLYNKGIRYKPYINLSSPYLLKIFKLFFPAAIGAAALQLNLLVDQRFASGLVNGSITFLETAFILMQFPLGLIPITFSTVLLPILSEHIVRKEFSKFNENYFFSLKIIFLLTVPASAGFLSAGSYIISLLFQHGAFKQEAVINTFQALKYYSIGLPFMAGVFIISRAFYSLKDTKTPLQVSLIAISVNIFLDYVLTRPEISLSFKGIALATSIASILNFMFLFIILSHRMKIYSMLPAFFLDIMKILFAGLISWIVVIIEIRFFSKLSYSLVGLSFWVLFLMISAGLSYFLCSYIFGIKELAQFLTMSKRKLFKG